MEERGDEPNVYKVVINHEEQYSIWPEDQPNPLGWRDAGTRGSKEECLAYIKEVWTDMRPRAFQGKLDEASQQQAMPTPQ